jgi:bifunctional UDP-N-acetylglucosamine pyrophosphorylase / glucosamine-1-phosphate N-acetyltransferase
MKNNNKSILIKKTIENRDKLIKKAYDLIDKGVLVHDPHRLDIRGTLECGNRVEIDINVVIEGEVILEDGVKIGAGSILKNCIVGKDTRINPFSVVEEAFIGKSSFIGPYGRIRPGTKIGDLVQIGNFVEIKNSTIGSKSRINHHSFIGDAFLEENITIGAGCITCNHDGDKINKTTIKQGVYIGSGCNLVAPLNINKNATIGAGSTITEDIEEGGLTIARSRQSVVKNWKKPRCNND